MYLIKRFQFKYYLCSWSHGKISKGLIYEGVPDDVLTGAECGDPKDGTSPRKRIYMGASAGQSAILQSLDALLGIEHFPGTSFHFLAGGSNLRHFSRKS